MLHLPVHKLKETLIADQLITAENFEEISQEGERLNQRIEDILISRGIVSPDYLYKFLARYLNVELIDLDEAKIDRQVLRLLSPDLANQKRVILFKKEADGILDAAMEDPSDLKTIEFLERFLKAKVKPFLVRPVDMEKGFAIYSRQQTEDFKKTIQENVQHSLQIREQNIEKAANAVPVVALVENFLAYAATSRASDVHIETLENEIVVRFRIDGILREIIRIPKEAHLPILARLKLLSNLKIDEHYKPQDGRFNIKVGEEKVDIRVSIMPTIFGEKIEMRLLPATQKPLSFEELGMMEDTIKLFKENLEKTFGIVLVCGPTGAGKTTTLYAVLNILNKPEVNIVTIEDPIEYYIKYVNQTQVNTTAGITFANALRAFLRQDPNIIMVGEVRDEETAEISVHAALTGHLVLSSLHTNTAAAAVPRLIDMKVPPFLVSAVLNAVLAQRLARKICPSCIESFSLSEEQISIITNQLKEIEGHADFELPKISFHGKGCSACNFSGYQGRVGIFELLNIDNEIRDLINSPQFALDKMEQLAKKKGMITMFEDGLRKVGLGMTTVEEVLRVIRE